MHINMIHLVMSSGHFQLYALFPIIYLLLDWWHFGIPDLVQIYSLWRNTCIVFMPSLYFHVLQIFYGYTFIISEATGSIIETKYYKGISYVYLKSSSFKCCSLTTILHFWKMMNNQSLTNGCLMIVTYVLFWSSLNSCRLPIVTYEVRGLRLTYGVTGIFELY